MMVVPLPRVLVGPSLKLHTTRSPLGIDPAVAGAITRPEGFRSPLVGAMVEPTVGIAPVGVNGLARVGGGGGWPGWRAGRRNGWGRPSGGAVAGWGGVA